MSKAGGNRDVKHETQPNGKIPSISAKASPDRTDAEAEAEAMAEIQGEIDSLARELADCPIPRTSGDSPFPTNLTDDTIPEPETPAVQPAEVENAALIEIQASVEEIRNTTAQTASTVGELNRAVDEFQTLTNESLESLTGMMANQQTMLELNRQRLASISNLFVRYLTKVAPELLTSPEKKAPLKPAGEILNQRIPDVKVTPSDKKTSPAPVVARPISAVANSPIAAANPTSPSSQLRSPIASATPAGMGPVPVGMTLMEYIVAQKPS